MSKHDKKKAGEFNKGKAKQPSAYQLEKMGKGGNHQVNPADMIGRHQPFNKHNR